MATAGEGEATPEEAAAVDELAATFAGEGFDVSDAEVDEDVSSEEE